MRRGMPTVRRELRPDGWSCLTLHDVVGGDAGLVPAGDDLPSGRTTNNAAPAGTGRTTDNAAPAGDCTDRSRGLVQRVSGLAP